MLVALTGAGLSAAAGLNAFIPLLIVGLLSRFTDVVALPDALSWIESWPFLIIAAVLLIAETALDKVPGVDHVNDLLQTAVRPVVGGVIFAGTTAAADIESSSFWQENPWIPAVLGAIVALVVHLGKAAARPAVNASTGGTGAPLVSIVEDTASAGLSLVAIFIPILVILVFIIMLVTGIWIWARGRAKRHARAVRKAEKRMLAEQEAADEESRKSLDSGE